MDTETPVVFRVDSEGLVFALLYAEPWFTRSRCIAYQHMGGHSGADYAACITASRPARPDEYAALRAEMESYPYNYRLRVYARRPVNRNPSR